MSLDALPFHLATPLAELATAELAEAAFGTSDIVARSTVSTVARTLDATTAVLALEDLKGGEPALRVAAASGAAAPEGRVAVEGPYAEALAQEAPVEADDLPGLGGPGTLLRIGTQQEPLALLTVIGRKLDASEHVFVRTVASILHSRLALNRQRHRLAESQERARAVIDTTVDGVITIDERGRIETFNPGAERIFGYTADEVRRPEHPRPHARAVPLGARRIYPGLPRHRRPPHHRHRARGRRAARKSGATFPMDLAVSEVRLASGSRIFTGLVRDISERRRWSSEVLRVAEEERRRIGQDLHDGLGQTLTGIGLFATRPRAAARRRGLGRPPKPPATWSLLVDEADAHARRLARSLVPVELERNGLETALARMAERARRLYGVDVSVPRRRAPGVPKPTCSRRRAATHLFRIAQEAVSNAVQHGRAATIRVGSSAAGDQLRLRVEDDGVGFNDRCGLAACWSPTRGSTRRGKPSSLWRGSHRASVSAPARPADHRGMGLRIMHYRAHLAGGALEIRPGSAGGTVVTCTVPLRFRRSA